MEGLLSMGPTPSSFHRIGPLGLFGLVVTMSVCLSVCLMSPSHAIFLNCWSQNGLYMEGGYLLILTISGERYHHNLVLFSYYSLYLIKYLKQVTKSSPVLLHGRHWISRLVRYVTLTQKSFHHTKLKCTELHCTAVATLHCTILHCITLQWTEI